MSKTNCAVYVDDNTPQRICCRNKRFKVGDLPVFINSANVPPGLTLCLYPTGDTDDAFVPAGIDIVAGSVMVTAPGTYVIKCPEGLDGTEAPEDPALWPAICCAETTAESIPALILEKLCSIADGEGIAISGDVIQLNQEAVLACLAELKTLVAMSNDATALAEILLALQEVCDKLLEQADQNTEVLTALEALCTKIESTVTALEAICDKIEAGNADQLACLEDIKTALATIVDAVSALADISASLTAVCEKLDAANESLTALCEKIDLLLAAVAAVAAAVVALKECNTEENTAICEKLEALLESAGSDSECLAKIKDLLGEAKKCNSEENTLLCEKLDAIIEALSKPVDSELAQFKGTKSQGALGDATKSLCYINGRPNSAAPWQWLDNADPDSPVVIAEGANLNEFTDAVEALGYTEYSSGEKHYICPLPATWTGPGSHFFTTDGDTSSKGEEVLNAEVPGAPSKEAVEALCFLRTRDCDNGRRDKLLQDLLDAQSELLTKMCAPCPLDVEVSAAGTLIATGDHVVLDGTTQVVYDQYGNNIGTSVITAVKGAGDNTLITLEPVFEGATAIGTVRPVQPPLPPPVLASGAVKWEHNDNNGTSYAGVSDVPAAVSDASDISFGSGLTLLDNSANEVEIPNGTTFEHVLTGANSDTFADAKEGDQYVEVAFTAAQNSSLVKIQHGLVPQAWGGSTAGNYKVAAEISDDGFATSDVLFEDGFQAMPNGDYTVAETPEVSAPLVAGKEYTVRFYPYAEENNASLANGTRLPDSTIAFDDLQLTVEYPEAFDKEAARK